MGVRVCARLTAVSLVIVVTWGGCRNPNPSPSVDPSTVRQEIERQNELNRQAFLREDLDAIMALRTDDFHAVTPDNQTRDRAWMRHYTEGLLNGIERWNHLTVEIDSLEIVGDEARAIVLQHADRMALRPDGKVHHVETWVTQREIWLRTPTGWKLRRVDGIRDQRRLVDGKEG
jgi:ketosteroid isomerase-like protein